ncbi:hypothetical protein Plhal304r1_c010g0039581 [Plasmopara halstedii]
MCTDSKTTGLIEQSGESYRKPHKWMSLVYQFPRYKVMLHNHREQQGCLKAVKQFPVLQDIAAHSRGRFAKYFVNKVVECAITNCTTNLCDLMNEACAAVS